MYTNEPTESDVREITTANQTPKVPLGDSGVGRESLEIEKLGPGRGRCCGATANLLGVMRRQTPLL